MMEHSSLIPHPSSLRSHLRRDQSQIRVPTFVHDRHPVRIGVAEDDELVLRVLETECGVFDRHRPDRQAACLDNPRRVVVVRVAQIAGLEDLDRPVAHRLAVAVTVMVADLLAVLLGLAFDVVDGGGVCLFQRFIRLLEGLYFLP